MRSLLALQLGTLFVAVAALVGPPDEGTAAYVRTGGSVAQAQAPATDQPTVSSRRTINLTEEDRHTIREIVLKDTNVRKVEENVKATIGEAPPQGVVTYEFPPLISSKIPQLKSHTYFVKGDEIIVVDSKAGKIADIVK
jgi:hypothetical protein